MYVCMYVCMHVCVCVCECVCMYVCNSMCVYVCLCTQTHTHTHTYIYIYIYIDTYTHKNALKCLQQMFTSKNSIYYDLFLCNNLVIVHLECTTAKLLLNCYSPAISVAFSPTDTDVILKIKIITCSEHTWYWLNNKSLCFTFMNIQCVNSYEYNLILRAATFIFTIVSARFKWF